MLDRTGLDFLERQGITRMEWPAVLPDMNPIEHIWDYLSNQLRQRQNPPQTLDLLEEAFIEEWRNIPQLLIANCIQSMPTSCQELLNARGGPTRY